jgi:L-asparaginase
MSLPRLHIIGTGGTIAGVSRRSTAAAVAGVSSSDKGLQAYDAGVLNVDALLQNLKLGDLRERFDITSEQLVNIDSKDMNPQVWWQLAQRLYALALDANVCGVVITHGTDTLEETSYFMELLRQSGAFARGRQGTAQMNIVLTAAMRPADAPDADGPQNLCDALAVAAHAGAAAQAVVCVLQGLVHAALHINKAHSSALDAFSSLPYAPIGQVSAGKVQCDAISSTTSAVSYTKLCLALTSSATVQWPWVALVMSHAGIDARVVSGLVQAGVQGIVVAATGNGTLSKTLLPALREAVAQGVVVRRASRVWQGGVVAHAGDEFESAGSMSAVKARVKLMMDICENS